MILLIVDTQNSIMTNDLYEFEIFVYRIKTLIKEARNNSIEVEVEPGIFLHQPKK